MFYISHMPMQTYNKKKKGGGTEQIWKLSYMLR